MNDSGICLKLPDYILQGAIFIPFLVSALSGLMGRALGDRIGTFSEYLRRLEQLLGKQGYGLEPHMVSNRKKVKAAFTQAWVILSLGSGAIAVVVYFLVDDRGICATKSAALPMALPALV